MILYQSIELSQSLQKVWNGNKSVVFFSNKQTNLFFAVFQIQSEECSLIHKYSQKKKKKNLTSTQKRENETRDLNLKHFEKVTGSITVSQRLTLSVVVSVENIWDLQSRSTLNESTLTEDLKSIAYISFTSHQCSSPNRGVWLPLIQFSSPLIHSNLKLMPPLEGLSG